jgi:hypothetical protein
VRPRRLSALFCVCALPATLAIPSAGAATPAAQGYEILAVRTSSPDDVSLVLVAPPGVHGPATMQVVAAGEQLPSTVDPALSDRSAIALVIDASTDAGQPLRGGGLAGAANFLLQLPSGAATAVIADRRPPEVVASISVGVTDDLRATSSIRAQGRRATADALALAMDQVSVRATAQPVIVLYTTASDAEGEPALVLAERVRAAGAVMAVVTAEEDDGYWQAVARLTGGAAIAVSAEGGALKAFDLAVDQLARRSTVTFRRPAADVDSVVLRVQAAGGPTSLDVPLPAAAVSALQAPAVGGQKPEGLRPWWITSGLVVAALVGAALVGAALVGAALVGAVRVGVRLRSRRRAIDHPSTTRPAPEPPAAPSAPDSPPAPSLFEKAADPSSDGRARQRDLVADNLRLARHDRAEGRLALAASGYRQAVDALEELSSLEPDDPSHVQDLVVTVTQLADLDLEQGWLEQAAAGYRRAIEIGERLVESAPDNGAYRHNLDRSRAQAAALPVAPPDPR